MSDNKFVLVPVELLKNLKDDFLKIVKTMNVDICLSDIECQVSIHPHVRPTSLPINKMAIYIFFYKGKCLKVGKVGPKSQARYISQHYNPNSSRSNLAKSIIIHQNKIGVSGLSNTNIKSWILNNTDRTNILIDEKYGTSLLNFLESFLQLKLNPEFEGFRRQIK